jgi:hypothetical protein
MSCNFIACKKSPQQLTVDEVMSDLPLRQSQTGVLLVFLAYCNWRGKEANEHGPINDDWTSITLRSFDNFRIGPHFRTPHRPETDPAAPAAANKSATTSEA